MTASKVLQNVVFLFLPFLVFYWITFQNLTIGNDYKDHPTPQQMELLFSLKNGTFPLYVPGFCDGTSASALTVGQLFHPITYLAELVPSYWEGNAHVINIFLRLLTLGITQIILFIFLLRLGISNLFSFLISFITIYNLRMLDIFRYGALESYTAHIILFVLSGYYYLNPKKHLSILIVLFTYLLVVSGHTQFMYLALCGNCLFIFLMPFFLSCILKEEIKKEKIKKYFLNIFTLIFVGILLSACYLFPFYFDFLQDNSERIGKNFQWAIGYQGGWTDLFNSFFNPFSSEVHGAFGGSSLIISALIFPILIFFKRKIPKIIFITWIFFLVTCLLSIGDEAPLYYFFWKYFPFANTFRTPGRVTIIIPLLALILFSWLFQEKKEEKIPSYVFLFPFSFILYLFYDALPAAYTASKGLYNPNTLSVISWNIRYMVFILGVVFFIGLVLYGIKKKFKFTLESIIIFTLISQTTLTIAYGTWVDKAPQTKTYNEMQDEKKDKLTDSLFSGHYRRKAVTEHLKKTTLEKRLARIEWDFVNISSNKEAYKRLSDAREKKYLLVEHGDQEQAKEKNKRGNLSLIYSSYNNLKFKVENNAPGFFVFSFPYSDYWKAFVNGKEEKIYRVNGIEQAVWIFQGKKEIEFKYFSKAQEAGIIISLVTLFFIFLYLISGLKNTGLKIISIFAIALICAGIFLGFKNSLYIGRDLETRYTWEN